VSTLSASTAEARRCNSTKTEIFARKLRETYHAPTEVIHRSGLSVSLFSPVRRPVRSTAEIKRIGSVESEDAAE